MSKELLFSDSEVQQFRSYDRSVVVSVAFDYLVRAAVVRHEGLFGETIDGSQVARFLGFSTQGLGRYSDENCRRQGIEPLNATTLISYLDWLQRHGLHGLARYDGQFEDFMSQRARKEKLLHDPSHHGPDFTDPYSGLSSSEDSAGSLPRVYLGSFPPPRSNKDIQIPYSSASYDDDDDDLSQDSDSAVEKIELAPIDWVACFGLFLCLGLFIVGPVPWYFTSALLFICIWILSKDNNKKGKKRDVS